MKKIFICICLILSALPVQAYAAQVLITPQESVVGYRTPFTMLVTISAQEAINTVDLKIHFPDSVDPIDVSNGNSIVSFWIEKPAFDPGSRTLTLSGIIPGGFSGDKAKLVSIRAQANTTGVSKIEVDNSSEVYLNSATPLADVLVAPPLFLVVSGAKNNIDNEIKDTSPPERFTPSIVQITDVTGKPQWYLEFSTTDKSSGVNRFEVRETRPFYVWQQEWRSAESPYLLSDQGLHSTVEVRAVDEQGNVREVKVPASGKPVSSVEILGIVLSLFAILIVVWSAIKGRTR